MNKTIKQLADELHVSKTAVRKYMDEEFRSKHTETDRNGVIVITPEGCKLIAEIIENNRKPIATTTENAVSADVLTIPREVWEALQAQMTEQAETIKSQRKQIDDYSQRLQEINTALLNEQNTAGRAQALHAGTIQHQLDAPGQKGGLFGWLSRWKKSPPTVQENGRSKSEG